MLKNLIIAIVVSVYCSDISAQVKDSLSTIYSDSVKVRRSELKAYPYVYYTPETSLAFGVGGIFTYYTSKSLKLNPSSVTLGGYYTINNQYKVTLKPIVYAGDNRFYFSLPITFGHFIDKFYGIGNQTPKDTTADYLKDVLEVTMVVQVPAFLFSSDRLGLVFDFNSTIITEDYKMENVLLVNDEVLGSNGGWNYGVGMEIV